MKRINRRQFAKLAGGVALAVPLAPELFWPQQAAKKPEPPHEARQPQQPEPAKPEPKFKLSREQEDAVKSAVERRDRQLTSLRARALPYDAEPAFVFRVRQRLRPTQKP